MKLLRLIKFCENLKHSITKTKELFYARAVVVTNRLGVKINKVAERKEPIWRRRLQRAEERLKSVRIIKG